MVSQIEKVKIDNYVARRKQVSRYEKGGETKRDCGKVQFLLVGTKRRAVKEEMIKIGLSRAVRL